MRIVFMGTAELACASLEALSHTPGFEVALVVTQPDRPKGRDLKLTPSPVKKVGLQLQIPILQPQRARDPQFLAQLAAVKPDLIVVAAFGQILPPAILELPPHGCLNVHTSLLPKYRGAAPIQWAILEGESETGVTIMKMDAGLDTGPILTQEKTLIGPEDTAQTLHDRLAKMGADLLVRTIPLYVSGGLMPRPQPNEGATYARKISKEDGRIDWTQPAQAIWNRVRAFTPWPGAFTFFNHRGQRRMLKVLSTEVLTDRSGEAGVILATERGCLIVGCGKGALAIAQVQVEGGRPVPVQAFLAGHALVPGDRFETVAA